MRKTRENEKHRRKTANNIRKLEFYQMEDSAPAKAAVRHMQHKPYS